MSSRLERFVLALVVALVIAGVVILTASAQTETPLPAATPSGDCASCHPERHAAWANGAHGAAKTTHVMEEASNCAACHKNIPNGEVSASAGADQTNFQETWMGQGKPPACLQCHATGYDPVTGTAKADGITCEACHSPISADHPKQDDPINTNTDLCRTCHSDARFGWDSWTSSVHYQQKMTCTTCHDPHSTSMKLADASSTDTSSLCVNCHKDVAKDSQHSKHTEAGVTCVACHLGPKKGNDDFHKVPDHSFTPKLETCNGCHADQMHGAGSTATTGLAEVSLPAAKQTAPAEIKSVENIQLSTKNGPISQTPEPPPNAFGFAGMAVVLGLVVGMVISLVRKQ
jgi:predicted CXXCH cytochrome family protein